MREVLAKTPVGPLGEANERSPRKDPSWSPVGPLGEATFAKSLRGPLEEGKFCADRKFVIAAVKFLQ